MLSTIFKKSMVLKVFHPTKISKSKLFKILLKDLMLQLKLIQSANNVLKLTILQDISYIKTLKFKLIKIQENLLNLQVRPFLIFSPKMMSKKLLQKLKKS